MGTKGIRNGISEIPTLTKEEREFIIASLPIEIQDKIIANSGKIISGLEEEVRELEERCTSIDTEAVLLEQSRDEWIEKNRKLQKAHNSLKLDSEEYKEKIEELQEQLESHQ